MSAIDDLLAELRASVAEKQDAPYLRAPELALLVGYIDELEAAGDRLMAAARSIAYTWETESTGKQMWDAWSKVQAARTTWMDARRAEDGQS